VVGRGGDLDIDAGVLDGPIAAYGPGQKASGLVVDVGDDHVRPVATMAARSSRAMALPIR
jgi:hypothetical protein